MGLYSFNCKSCGHPALFSNANFINAWMKNVVVLFKDGERIEGAYNGYGGVYGFDRRMEYDGAFTLYHAACWHVLGGPTKYAGKSKSAADQGHFYAAGAHDMADPRRVAPRPVVKFTIEEQIERQRLKVTTLDEQIGRMMSRRVSAEEKLAKLYGRRR